MPQPYPHVAARLKWHRLYHPASPGVSRRPGCRYTRRMTDSPNSEAGNGRVGTVDWLGNRRTRPAAPHWQGPIRSFDRPAVIRCEPVGTDSENFLEPIPRPIGLPALRLLLGQKHLVDFNLRECVAGHLSGRFFLASSHSSKIISTCAVSVRLSCFAAFPTAALISGSTRAPNGIFGIT
jgi:hypothetical protein